MKKLQPCTVENCIPTPTSCMEWNGGDIDYLGICNGESINNVVWEIVAKLQGLAGDDLSKFDIDSLLTICNQSAPLETNLLSILTLLKNNDICLKDYIDTLNNKLNELSSSSGVSVNLKCYADFDNLGNALSITREQLDQLVIDNLCNHKGRIENLEGDVVLLQSQINNISTSTTVDELAFSTCIDSGTKPTSSQVIITAQAHCDLETETGNPADIAAALSKTAGDLNAEFGLLAGWNLTPANWAENYGNLLLEVESLRQRVIFMETNCCAITCDDIKIGYSAAFNEDSSGIILKFTFGSGTSIPAGLTDQGSTGTFTDIDGNVESFSLTIAMNATIEIPISGLNLSGQIDISINAKIGSNALLCEKCVGRTLKGNPCSFCTLTASDTATIFYKICSS